MKFDKDHLILLCKYNRPVLAIKADKGRYELQIAKIMTVLHQMGSKYVITYNQDTNFAQILKHLDGLESFNFVGDKETEQLLSQTKVLEVN